MSFSPRHLGCLLFPLIVAAAPTPSTVAPQPTDHPDTAIASPLSRRHEVRLRKLHLVRPDLIQYPIAYEVHC